MFHGARRGAWSALMTVPEVKSFDRRVKCDECNTGARYSEVYEEARRLCHGGGRSWKSSQVKKSKTRGVFFLLSLLAILIGINDDDGQTNCAETESTLLQVIFWQRLTTQQGRRCMGPDHTSKYISFTVSLLATPLTPLLDGLPVTFLPGSQLS